MLTNPAEFRRICQLRKTRRLVSCVHEASRKADLLRKELDETIYRPLLEQMQLRETRNGRDGAIITDADRLYLCEDDEACKRFYDACSDKIAEAGYDVERGYCPALVASREHMEVQRALVKHLEQWFPEMTWEALNRKLGTLDKYLSLICGAVGLRD